MNAIYDTVVVGYGPAGAVAAASVAAGGHRVAVIERQPNMYPLPRMATFDGEAFRTIQAIAGDRVDEALATSVVLDDCDFVDADHAPLIPIDWSGTQCGYPAHSSVFQPDVERVAQESIAEMSNVDVFRGTEVVKIEQDSEAVQLTVRPKGTTDNDRARTITAKYVVGADGTNSFTRRAVGIEMKDYGLDERWLNFDMDKFKELPDKFSKLTLVMDPRRPYMWMPLGSDRQRFEFRVDPSETDEEMGEEAVVWEFLAEHGITREDASICRQVVYPYATRVAKAWRSGRVFIAGDAAHTMTPYMGQGGCSAIRDGRNIGWKLNLVLAGAVEESVLDLYQQEREPHVTEIVMRSDQLARLINIVDPSAAEDRNHALRQAPAGDAEPFPKLTVGVLHHESDGSISEVTGTPAPQGLLSRDGVTLRGDEHLGHGFQLISRSHPNLTETERETFESIGGHVGVIEDSTSPDAILDVDGTYRNFLDSHSADFMIIRPDWAVFGVGPATAVSDYSSELFELLNVAKHVGPEQVAAS